MASRHRTVHPSDTVNEHDQGAVLTIALALSISLMLLFLSTRLLIRWPWKQLFGKDDVCVIAATLLGLSQALVSFSSIANGLGSTASENVNMATNVVQRLVFASDILFAATMYTDKCAVILFFFRLSSSAGAFRMCSVLLAMCVMFFTASMLILSLETPLSSPWSTAMHADRVPRWIVFEVLSCGLEIAVVSFPVFLVKDLQMKTQAKASVVGWFSLRLLILPLAICRLLSFSTTVSEDHHLLYHFVGPQVLLQAQMCYSVVAATLPCLRIFLKSASAHFLDGDTYLNPTTTNTATAGSSAHEMSRMSRKERHSQGLALSGAQSHTVAYAMKASDQEKASIASDSSRREIIVKHTVDLAYD